MVPQLPKAVKYCVTPAPPLYREDGECGHVRPRILLYVPPSTKSASGDNNAQTPYGYGVKKKKNISHTAADRTVLRTVQTKSAFLTISHQG